MYRVNPLERNVLITSDEVIFHAPTKHTLDPRIIEQSIIIAEERLIRSAICDDYYYSLIDQKNKIVTSDNQVELQKLVDDSLPPKSKPYTLAIGDIVNASEFLKPNDLKLWKMYLWKLTSEVVLMVATPEGFVQFGSEGVVHNQPASSPMTTSGIVTPELRSVKWTIDIKMRDRVDPLIEAMHNWLCKNKQSYPLYCKPCDCDSNGVAYKRKTDWVNVYDEIDNPHTKCGCKNWGLYD